MNPRDRFFFYTYYKYNLYLHIFILINYEHYTEEIYITSISIFDINVSSKGKYHISKCNICMLYISMRVYNILNNIIRVLYSSQSHHSQVPTSSKKKFGANKRQVSSHKLPPYDLLSIPRISL